MNCVAKVSVVLLGITLAFAQATKPFTGEDLIKMKKEGFDDQTMIKAIEANGSAIDASLDSLVALRRAGVSDNVIKAALSVGQSKSFTTGASNLPSGTEVLLVLTETVTSEKAHVRDVIHFKVSNDVLVNGVVVVPKGTSAEGLVTVAHPRGSMGRPGDLAISVTRLKLSGGGVRLRGQLGGQFEGVGFGTAVVVGVGGVFKKGKSVTFPEGTSVKAMVEGLD